MSLAWLGLKEKMDDIVGWRIIFFGAIHDSHLGPVETLREAFASAYWCHNSKDKRNPLVYYGTKRLG
jgi:hypothetical protein